jgi:hypothetical protein
MKQRPSTFSIVFSVKGKTREVLVRVFSSAGSSAVLVPPDGGTNTIDEAVFPHSSFGFTGECRL